MPAHVTDPDRRVSESTIEAAPASLPLDALACPRCDRELDLRSEHLHCKGCNVDFPMLDGIPWLFAEPNAALNEWRNRYQFAIDRVSQEADQAARAAKGDVRAATKARLIHLGKAKRAFAKELEALLAPLEAKPTAPPIETHLALRTRLPPSQGIDTYHANAHRDWCWGDEETCGCCWQPCHSLTMLAGWPLSGGWVGRVSLFRNSLAEDNAAPAT